jgi:hypothetical protein
MAFLYGKATSRESPPVIILPKMLEPRRSRALPKRGVAVLYLRRARNGWLRGRDWEIKAAGRLTVILARASGMDREPCLAARRAAPPNDGRRRWNCRDPSRRRAGQLPCSAARYPAAGTVRRAAFSSAIAASGLDRRCCRWLSCRQVHCHSCSRRERICRAGLQRGTGGEHAYFRRCEM